MDQFAADYWRALRALFAEEIAACTIALLRCRIRHGAGVIFLYWRVFKFRRMLKKVCRGALLITDR